MEDKTFVYDVMKWNLENEKSRFIDTPRYRFKLKKLIKHNIEYLRGEVDREWDKIIANRKK